MNTTPQFPPLLSGRMTAGADPFAAACRAAAEGCDAGLILYDPGPEVLRAAIVLAPEVPLCRAMAMLPLAQVGLQNALGALGPAELPVQMEWDGTLRVNGGHCGGFSACASDADPAAVPDWLVIGFSLRFVPESDEAGADPDRTALYSEGCGDLFPQDLLESWARHTLAWLHRWEAEGTAPLHREWSGLLTGTDGPVASGGTTGAYLGIDEDLGLLLKTENGTRLIPLTAQLTETPA